MDGGRLEGVRAARQEARRHHRQHSESRRHGLDRGRDAQALEDGQRARNGSRHCHTGAFLSPDPYKDIAAVAPYAVNWRIKTHLAGRKIKTDLKRIVQIATDAGYRGYLPIETLRSRANRTTRMPA